MVAFDPRVGDDQIGQHADHPNGRAPSGEQVYLVTDAQPGHSADLADRRRKYYISMAIRTVCIGLAIFVLTGPARWIAVAAAVVLPYLAVVIANAGPLRDRERPAFFVHERPTIESGHPPTAGGDAETHKAQQHEAQQT